MPVTMNQPDMLESQSTDISFYSDVTTINIQPQVAGATRRPIPVLNWQSHVQFNPMHGLEFLSSLDQVVVQQSVELNEPHEASENRYTVKIPHGETVYYASETSSSCQRAFFGATRSFTMKLFDKTHQEALEFRRRLACGTCSFWCYLQELQVWMSEELIGSIKQEIGTSIPIFTIIDQLKTPLYRIQGPTTLPCLMGGKDVHFKICGPDGITHVGNIHRQWDQIQLVHNLCVRFPSRLRDVQHKALILGASFLLEYMYFTKVCGCRCFC